MSLSWAEYIPQIERLKEVFGDKAYPEERVKSLYNAVRGLTLQNFTKIVTDLIDSKRQAPLKPDFQEAARKYLADNENRIRAEMEARWAGRACRWCGNSGAVFLTRKSNGHEFAVTCSCEWGRFEFGSSDKVFHTGYLDTCEVFDVAGPQSRQASRPVSAEKLGVRTAALFQDMPGGE